MTDVDRPTPSSPPVSAGGTGGGADPVPPKLAQGIDRVLSVQRPVVLAHLRALRRSKPDAAPAELIAILERRYLAAVTGGGALVGASAAIPAVGVGTSLALSGVETVGFLETSALFAQSVTELHGIAVADPDRARTLVMALMLGTAGQDLLQQFALQAAGRGSSRNAYWGEVVTKSLPRAALGPITDRIQKEFVRRFAVTQGTSVVGRMIPFGVGAVIGGTGNHLLGRKVVQASRAAFGPPPAVLPPALAAELAPRVREPKAPRAPRSPRPDGSTRSPLARVRAALPRGRRRGDDAIIDVEPTSVENSAPGGAEPPAAEIDATAASALPPPTASDRRPD